MSPSDPSHYLSLSWAGFEMPITQQHHWLASSFQSPCQGNSMPPHAWESPSLLWTGALWDIVSQCPERKSWKVLEGIERREATPQKSSQLVWMIQKVVDQGNQWQEMAWDQGHTCLSLGKVATCGAGRESPPGSQLGNLQLRLEVSQF